MCLNLSKESTAYGANGVKVCGVGVLTVEFFNSSILSAFWIGSDCSDSIGLDSISSISV